MEGALPVMPAPWPAADFIPSPASRQDDLIVKLRQDVPLPNELTLRRVRQTLRQKVPKNPSLSLHSASAVHLRLVVSENPRVFREIRGCRSGYCSTAWRVFRNSSTECAEIDSDMPGFDGNMWLPIPTRFPFRSITGWPSATPVLLSW